MIYRISHGINGRPIEMAEFIKTVVDYFIQNGWKDIYAWNLVYTQAQNMALKELENAIKLDNSPLVIEKEEDDIRMDYIRIIKRIVEVLSNYLPEDRREKMEYELERLVLKHCEKWGI